jgi:hypothetical protein
MAGDSNFSVSYLFKGIDAGFSQMIGKMEGSLGKIKSQLTSMAAGAISAGAAFRVFSDQLKSTQTGVELLNTASLAWRKTLSDIPNLLNRPGGGGILKNITEAAKAGREWNDIVRENFLENAEVAKLTSQIEELRYEMADSFTTEAQRAELATKALDKWNERKALQLRNAKEEFGWYQKMIEKMPDDIKIREGYIKTLELLIQLQGFDREARTLLKASTKEGFKPGSYLEAVEKDVEEQKKVIAELQRIKDKQNALLAGSSDFVSKYDLFLSGQSMSEKYGKRKEFKDVKKDIGEVSVSLEGQMAIVDKLTGTFQDMFSNIAGGFKGMIDAFKSSLLSFAAELAARAAIFGILSLFAGGTPIAARALTGLRKFVGIPGFAGGTNFAPGGLAVVGERGPELVNLPRGSQVIPNGGSQLVAVVKGTDLHFILQRAQRQLTTNT